MSVVEGVSFVQTGTFATSFTAFVTTEQSPLLLPIFEPMSSRSMCGHEKFSSRPSTPSSCQAFVRSCHLWSSLSLPAPAMIEATSTFFGWVFLIRERRPIHQSSGLSEISSQFHDEWSTESGRLFIETRGVWTSVLRNFVFAPATFTTGCRPIALVTTPPHPASNARMMFVSDSVGGADARRNGFSNRIPVNVTERSALMETSPEKRESSA